MTLLYDPALPPELSMDYTVLVHLGSLVISTTVFFVLFGYQLPAMKVSIRDYTRKKERNIVYNTSVTEIEKKTKKLHDMAKIFILKISMSLHYSSFLITW